MCSEMSGGSWNEADARMDPVGYDPRAFQRHPKRREETGRFSGRGNPTDGMPSSFKVGRIRRTDSTFEVTSFDFLPQTPSADHLEPRRVLHETLDLVIRNHNPGGCGCGCVCAGDRPGAVEAGERLGEQLLDEVEVVARLLSVQLLEGHVRRRGRLHVGEGPRERQEVCRIARMTSECADGVQEEPEVGALCGR